MEQERVQLAKRVRETRYAYDQARVAADHATRLQDQLESEAQARHNLAELSGVAAQVGERNLDVTRGRLAAETARAQSRGSQENLRVKDLAYQSALQKYQHRLSADALVKIGAHPRLVIDIQVSIDDALQPTLYRFDGSLTNLVKSPLVVPNNDVNADLKKQLELLDSALLDARDPAAYRQAIDALKKPAAGADAVLYAPLHDAHVLEEFLSPSRVTSQTRDLKKRRDRLKTEKRYAEADDVQRELDALTYTQPDSTRVSANIQTLLQLALVDKTLSLDGKKYVVAGHTWLKSKYRPFGFQLRRRDVGVRVVEPPDLHLDTFQTLLKGYAAAVGDHTDVPDVSKPEAAIEAFFVDSDTAPALSAKDMTGGGVKAAAQAVDAALNAPATKYTTSILSGLEAILRAPAQATSWVSRVSGVTDAVRGAVNSSATLGAAYEALRSDPINPYAIFRYVLTNRTQYGTFSDISWNHHIGRYARIPTQEGKCRAFIYEYLAYRASIYSDFFQAKRYSGYADLPFMVGSRKNSSLIYKLLNTRFDPALQEPLTALLKAWRSYDRRVYHRAARLMHFDALILRFLCREVLLRTLSETACAINILAVKLLMRQAAACRNRDNSFECVRKLSQMAAKLITKKLPALTLPPELPLPAHHTQPALLVPETPLLETLRDLTYKVNGVPVTLPVLEPECPDELLTTKDNYLGETGRYISLLEDEVAKMKDAEDVRLYLSLSHAAPCAKLTHAVLTSKLRLYEERMADIIAAAAKPREQINRLHAMLEANVLNAARNVLAGKTPFETTYEFQPDFAKHLTEYKCKAHKPPVFDRWYDDLNRLHAAYAADLTSLFTPVAALAKVVYDLYASDSTKTPFQAFNQLDYAISAYDLLADSCAQTYDATAFEAAEKKRDLDSATKYLRTLLDLMDGASRAVAPPEIQLAAYKTEPDNTEAIFDLFMHDDAEVALNLHMPMRLSAKKIWKRYLDIRRDDPIKAKEFLENSGDLKSNAFAAHQLYDDVPEMIRAHQYVEAIQALRLILSFNVYRYNWNQFFKLPTFEMQREQLQFLLDDMSESFRNELNARPTADLDDRAHLLELAKAYKATIDARMKQVLHYLYVLNMAIGKRSDAAGYLKRLDQRDFSAYYAAIDANRAGQSVYDLRTTFRSSEDWTIEKLLTKIRAAKPTTNEGVQTRLAFLLQFSDLSWKTPDIDYAQALVLLSPDHVLNRIVQHVSTALYPDATDITPARTLVANLMYTYRKNAYPDDPKYGNALIERVLQGLPRAAADLATRVDAEVAAFAPTQQRQEAMKYIQRAVRARENLWPGEHKSVLSQFTENLPYLDGEYTLNIVVQVKLLSETHPLVVLKNKPNKNCADKTEEVKLLRRVLFKTPTASAVPSAPK